MLDAERLTQTEAKCCALRNACRTRRYYASPPTMNSPWRSPAENDGCGAEHSAQQRPSLQSGDAVYSPAVSIRRSGAPWRSRAPPTRHQGMRASPLQGPNAADATADGAQRSLQHLLEFTSDILPSETVLWQRRWTDWSCTGQAHSACSPTGAEVHRLTRQWSRRPKARRRRRQRLVAFRFVRCSIRCGFVHTFNLWCAQRVRVGRHPRCQWGPTKHRTDRTDHTGRTGREIAARKAQINYRDLVINLYTAYHAMHDELSKKFYRKKFTDDRQTLCNRKRRNTVPTAPANNLLQENPKLTAATQ